MQRFPFIFILFFVFLHISSISQSNLPDKFLNGRELKTGDVGFVAYNIEEKKEVVSVNPDKLLLPASIQKVLSTNVALDILGENYTFKTSIGFTGEIENNILLGDLIIIGGGDPTIGFDLRAGKSMYPSEFFEFIKEVLDDNNIREIRGLVILDVSHFNRQPLPDGWAWSDIGNYYGAGSYGFNYLGNRYSLFFKSGKSKGADTEIIDMFPRIDLEIENRVKSMDIYSDRAFLYGGPYQKNILAEGAIPLSQTRFEVKGSLPDPPRTFLDTFSNQLKSWKISFTETKVVYDEKIQYQLLGVFKSAPLGEIVSYTNRKSDNFFAETILKELGASEGEGSTRKGLEVINEYFDNRELPALAITDASGLSRTNRLSAGQMVEFLKYQLKYNERNFTAFGLSNAGKSGSLKKLGPGTCYSGKLMGKSGYMKGVRSYTGIFLNERNERIVFCVIINNHNCSASRARQIIAEMLEEVFCN